GTRPAPRSTRALNVCALNCAPVFAAIRPARCRPCCLSVRPPSNSNVGSPHPSTRTALATASLDTRAGFSISGTGATPQPSSQAVLAGSINAVTFPGGESAAAIAAAPSLDTADASEEVRTQLQADRAIDSMSDVSGASYRR